MHVTHFPDNNKKQQKELKGDIILGTCYSVQIIKEIDVKNHKS